MKSKKEILQNNKTKALQENLLLWYQENHRKLPWRETSDPYRIWLSEIMCQQTQVATVIPYYERFLDQYPTIQDLALATEDEVYKLWEGLGYYSRAKRLMLCAREVVEDYEGIFPKSYREMIKLPGIGPYTAGAILSIAYNVMEPAIDGNVMRVYSRLYEIEADVGKPGAAKAFDPYVRADLPEEVSHYNQGLMELGARICAPTSPKCHICPLVDQCLAKSNDRHVDLPIKTKKPKKKHKTMAVIMVEHEGRILLEKRATEGLLANLWGFPAVEVDQVSKVDESVDSIDGNTHRQIANAIYESYGLEIEYKSVLNHKKHVFTHLIWDMTLYLYKANTINIIEEPEVAWIRREEIDQYPLPTAFLKLLS